MIRLAHPQIERIFEFKENTFCSLIIENPVFFRRVISGLITQTNTDTGEFVLSQDYSPIKITKNMEVITQFTPFDANRKSLLTKICSALEKRAADETHFLMTREIIAGIECYLYDISEDMPGDISFEKISVGGIIKAAGVQIADNSEDELERVLNYMELTRDLESDKVFVLVNMRSFFSDDEMRRFAECFMTKKFRVLLIDSRERCKLSGEVRCLIDDELCEI